MTVKDCICSSDKEILFIELSNRFQKQNCIKWETFCSLLNDIEKRIPEDINGKLVIRKIEGDGSLDTFWIDSNGRDYSLMFMRWDDLLGLHIDEDTLRIFDISLIASCVLWELTWFGYKEDDMIMYEEESSNFNLDDVEITSIDDLLNSE
jgi:hypothetical protein